MRFQQSLSIIMGAAALVDVSMAAAVGTKLVARDSPFSDLGLSDEFWGTYNDYCRNGVGSSGAKRSQLQARADPPANYDNISPGKLVSYFNAITTNGAWTDFLVSCHGIVITGDASSPVTKNKLLAHSYATEALLDEIWDKIKKELDYADLTNMRSYLSVPDRSAPENLNPDDMKKVEDKMIELLTGLTGSAPTVRYHNMADATKRIGDAGTMQLNNADKSVKIDGQDV